MRRLIATLLVLIPICVGLFVRFDDLRVWNKHKKFFYIKDRPPLTSYDGFLYARYSEDFLKGIYKGGHKDKLRFVPDVYLYEKGFRKYPIVIPLGSFLVAVIKKITGAKYIESVVIWFTPIMAILFVFPLVLFMSRIGFPYSGYLGSIAGCVSLIYLMRTQIGRFDTDCLNIFFPLIAAYFMLRYLEEENTKKRYLWLFLVGASFQLFWWWYFHPGLILVQFMFFLMAWVLKTKDLYILVKRWKELAFLVLITNPYILTRGVLKLFLKFKKYILASFKTAVPTGFPNVLRSISEAKHFNLKVTAFITCGNEIILILGIAGFLLFVLRRFWQSLLLAPLFMLGLLVLFAGNRFGMYLAPFVGVGLGVIFELALGYILERRSKSAVIREVFLAGVFALLTVFILFSNELSFSYIAKPKANPALAGDFIKLKYITPEDAWIWTWWDYGYAIQFLGRRATFHDGGSQRSPKTYFIATTFSYSDPSKAYNTISAISSKGIVYFRELIKRGRKPEEIKKEIAEGKYNAPLKNPVYWVFTEDLVSKFSWINFFGTWDFKTRNGLKRTIVKMGLCKVVSKVNLSCPNYNINLADGLLFMKNEKKTFLIKKLVVRNYAKIVEKDYREKGVVVELVRMGKDFLGYLTTMQPYLSMFNQMYILRKYDVRFFEPVYDHFPVMVVYKVKREPQNPVRKLQ